MNTKEDILRLPHIGLNSRELLPEQSGIYYVLDETYIIWYIGQAKNLRSRWAGDNHHRLYQLQKQRKKQLTIYYEFVANSQLDSIERQRIEQYNPQLNGTKVKKKKLHPTETLLRETLVILAPHSFVLGVESPRKRDLKFIQDSADWRDKWRIHNAVLPLNVIHVCINLNELQEALKDRMSAIHFLRKIFRKRSNYSNDWDCKGEKHFEKFGKFLLRRLLVNGFAIEVYEARQETVKHIQGYELTQLAGVNIRAVNEASLAVLKNKCLLGFVGMYVPSDNQNHPYQELCRRAIERVAPYKEDLVKLLFNEDLDTSKLQILPTELKTKEESPTGLPVRLANIAAKKEYLKSLLLERGLDLRRYQVNKYLEKIPKNDIYVESNHDKRMFVYIKSFIYGDLRKPIYYAENIYGSQGFIHQLPNLLDCPYKEVYLASTVDRAFWLLLETYLSDFVKVELNAEEGYINKVYVSARKILVPAMLTVTLNGKWKADIPFGPNNDMSCSEVANIIRSRLQDSGIPKLKFSFKSESTRT
jgi:predicted GIY-YIG superfamily endonuclease